MSKTRDAILDIVTALGGSTSGVGQLDRDALDRLADTVAGEEVSVSQGMFNCDVLEAIAQHASGWSQGGGGGGGGAQAVDVTLWNNSEDASLMQMVPEHIRLLDGYDENHRPVYSDPIPFEQVTTEFMDSTVYGVRISEVQVGSAVRLELPAGYTLDYMGIVYATADAPFPPFVGVAGGPMVPRPLDGFVVSGVFEIISQV